LGLFGFGSLLIFGVPTVIMTVALWRLALYDRAKRRRAEVLRRRSRARQAIRLVIKSPWTFAKRASSRSAPGQAKRQVAPEQEGGVQPSEGQQSRVMAPAQEAGVEPSPVRQTL